MISYWYRLLHGQFKLWQLIALGIMWIGFGVALHVILRDLGGIGLAPGLLFYGSGAFHFWIAHKAVKELRALDAMEDAAAAREAQSAEQRSPPRAKPPGTPTETPLLQGPRIGDDPFRNPPHRPLLIERPDVKPVATPIIAGDPDDKPTILT